jgi:hypothetical protein
MDVEVDADTGQVRVLRYVALRRWAAINPNASGSIRAGWHRAGYALSEESRLEEGMVTSSLFADYLIPTSASPRYRTNRARDRTRKDRSEREDREAAIAPRGSCRARSRMQPVRDWGFRRERILRAMWDARRPV